MLEGALATIIGFLVMLNPFGLFLYLDPIMRELSNKDFRAVLLKASAISFIIYFLFLLFGEFILNDIFQIRFESFRIFGGIIIFSFAYLYIVQGHRAMITMKGSLDDLASEIALPFMVGAGTISLTILMSHQYSLLFGMLFLVLVITVNFLIILLLKYIRDQIKTHVTKIAFDKQMQLLLRLLGFFVGAIGVNMVIVGITNLIS